MSGDYHSLVERLWRAALLLLATAFAVYLTWQLIERLLPLLLLAGGVLLVITLVLGGSGPRRRRW